MRLERNNPSIFWELAVIFPQIIQPKMFDSCQNLTFSKTIAIVPTFQSSQKCQNSRRLLQRTKFKNQKKENKNLSISSFLLFEFAELMLPTPQKRLAREKEKILTFLAKRQSDIPQ